MNADTNTCWYIVTRHEQYYDAACEALSGAVAVSGVIEELIHALLVLSVPHTQCFFT